MCEVKIEKEKRILALDARIQTLSGRSTECGAIIRKLIRRKRALEK